MVLGQNLQSSKCTVSSLTASTLTTSSSSTSLPSTKCPITRQEMNDPVLAQDGYTYERSAIEEYIRSNGKSPKTHQPLSISALVPNRALKEEIKSIQLWRRSSVSFITAPGRLSNDESTYTELYSTILNATKAEHHTNAFNTDETIVHITLPESSIITDAANHALNHICCVIDVSGSMAGEATCHDADGRGVHTGLSILNVVKYATEVIARSLSKHEYMSIITYSTDATVVMPPTPMTDHGKKVVTKKLSFIKPENRTNLWAGIKKGLEQADKIKQRSITSIFVLTDGLPNVPPELGYDGELKNALSNSPLFGSLSTFGFGQQLDSPLLVNLAKIGGGTFSFIPDSGMVGTIFINAIANARCSFGVKPMLKIKGRGPSFGGETRARGLYCTTTNKDVCVHLSPLRYDTTLDVVLPNHLVCSDDDIFDMELVFQIVGGREVHVKVKTDNSTDEIFDLFDSTRMSLVSTISKVTRSSEYDPSIRHSFTISDEAQNKRVYNERLDSLCKDIEDQAIRAISNESCYKSWGRHYLFSLRDAHLNQICNNFKDPGVQVYGNGERFKQLQEKLNEAFDEVSPPKPRRRRGAKEAPRQPMSMTIQFNNPDAICVHGDTLLQVRLNEGVITAVPISQVKRGDYVQTENGGFVKVDCIVQTTLEQDCDSFQLIRFGDLLITPYHPIKVNSTWHFPINCPNADLIDTDVKSVYNLVLEEQGRHQGVIMGGVCCSTLGHGLKDNATIQHAYFGTEKVVLDLQKIESYWKMGHVTLRSSDIKRSSSCGEINKIMVTNMFGEEMANTNSMELVATC